MSQIPKNHKNSQIAPFEYELLNEQIAQYPPEVRGQSRLLVVNRSDDSLLDRTYQDCLDYMSPGDVLVLNDTRVIPARLVAIKQSGAERELFLSERHNGQLLSLTARVVYRGSLRAGDILRVGDESIEVIEILGNGEAMIRAAVPPIILAERFGHTPLPPYIKRDDTEDDKERYQAVFARNNGSVAAPTASLNLTPALLKRIRAKGVIIVKLTLHVGRGTFLPIRADSVESHVMHQEYYSIPKSTLQAIRLARSSGHRIIAIGTTVTRALEHAAAAILGHAIGPVQAEADIFIYPGYEFKVVDRLLTNFHAPDSTVLQLAAAFAGVKLLEQAYHHALSSDYRFLSYGDSMMIV